MKIKNQNKKKKEEEEDIKDENEKQNEDINFPGGYSFYHETIYAENKKFPINNSNVINQNNNTQKNNRIIILPEKNSNHIDTLTNMLPEGKINKYYQ